MPVVEARNDSLPSIFGADRPASSLSSTKPRILPPCASLLAQTTHTSANGELVIQVLLPESTNPSPSGLAVVRIAEGSEPASGSVRPKQPISSPRARPGRYLAFCASDPKAWIG